MDRNSLAMEWTNFTASSPTNLPQSSSSSSQYNNSSLFQRSSSSMLHNVVNNNDTTTNCINLTDQFLNVDQFNMESFKNDCILNLDQSMLADDHQHHHHQQQHLHHNHSSDIVGIATKHGINENVDDDGNDSSINNVNHLIDDGDNELDLVTFHMHDDCTVDNDHRQSSPLMDLEKPIMNIMVDNLSEEKF